MQTSFPRIAETIRPFPWIGILLVPDVFLDHRGKSVMLRKPWISTGLGLVGFLVESLSTAALSYYGVSSADDWIIPMGIIGAGAAVRLNWILARR